MDSNSVGGFAPSSLLRVIDGSGNPAAASALTQANFTSLMALINGSSTQYVQASTSSGAGLPSLPAPPATPSAGDLWFDSMTHTLQYYDGTATQSLSTGGGGAGTVTSVTTGSGLAGGPITTTGTIALATVGTAGTYTKVTTDQYGRVIAGSQITGNDITSGTISGITAINTSGAITTSGNVSASNVSANGGSFRTLVLNDNTVPTSNTVTLQTTNPVTSSYTLTFPNSGPLSGSVLSSDASGNLSWTAPASGTVTNVGLTPPSGFMTVSPGAVTSTGTFSLSLASQNGNQIFAGPTTGTGTPTFRSLVLNDLPGIDWSKLTPGTLPSTLAGYGITDGVKDIGSSAPSIEEGTDAAKPAASAAGRIYIATDTFKIYRDNGATWDVVGTAASGSGTVQSVGMTVPGYMSVANSPINSSGTFGLSFVSESANLFFAGPTGGAAGAPSFRALALSDLPAIPNSGLQNSSITLGTTLVTLGATANSLSALSSVGLGVNGTTNGTLTMASTGGATTTIQPDTSTSVAWTMSLPSNGGSNGQVLQTDGAGNTAWVTPGASGVTNVGMAVPTFLSVSGGPITSAGTFTVTLASETANLIFAGPTGGAAGTPAFRSLVAADIPALPNSNLQNNSITLGSTSVSLGATASSS